MAINLIEGIVKYVTDYLDTQYATASKSIYLEGRGGYAIDRDFTGAGKVRLMKISSDGLGEYRPANTLLDAAPGHAHYEGYNGTGVRGGYPVKALNTEWETYALAYDRGAQFVLDRVTDIQSAGMALAYQLPEFIRTKVIPEIDATRFSKLAGYTSTALGNRKEETPTDETIVGDLEAVFALLENREVPAEDQIIFVSPEVNSMLRTSPQISRFITQGDFRSPTGLTFNVAMFEGRPIIVVPENRFYTDVVLGANGYYPGATSKKINYIVCSRNACLPVMRINMSRVYGPELVHEFDGYVINCHLWHDLFVPENKRIGVYASVSATSATGAKLLVSTKAGTATNGFIVDYVQTLPEGLAYDQIVYNTTADFTLGANTEVTGNVKAIELGAEATETTATDAYFAVLRGGAVLAKSAGKVSLNKKTD